MRGQRSLDAFLVKKSDIGAAAAAADGDSDFQETPHRPCAASEVTVKPLKKAKSKSKAKASPQPKVVKRRRAPVNCAVAAPLADHSTRAAVQLANGDRNLTRGIFDSFRKCNRSSGTDVSAACKETIIISDSESDGSDLLSG